MVEKTSTDQKTQLNIQVMKGNHYSGEKFDSYVMVETLNKEDKQQTELCAKDKMHNWRHVSNQVVKINYQLLKELYLELYSKEDEVKLSWYRKNEPIDILVNNIY